MPEHEKFLREQLEELRRQYEEAARPILMQLEVILRYERPRDRFISLEVRFKEFEE